MKNAKRRVVSRGHNTSKLNCIQDSDICATRQINLGLPKAFFYYRYWRDSSADVNGKCWIKNNNTQRCFHRMKCKAVLWQRIRMFILHQYFHKDNTNCMWKRLNPADKKYFPTFWQKLACFIKHFSSKF